MHVQAFIFCIMIYSSIPMQPSTQTPPKKPSRFAERPPDLDPKTLKVHLKKIEFYLAWAKENFHLYDEL